MAAGWACWCRKKLIEALQAGDKAVLAKFAADQSYTSSPQPIDGLINAAQDSSSQPEPEEAGEINHIPVHPQSQNMQCVICHPQDRTVEVTVQASRAAQYRQAKQTLWCND